MTLRNSRIRFIAGVAAGALACAAMTTDARADATTQIGNATVTAGVGTAILTLPDVEYLKILNIAAAPGVVIGTIKDADDFGDEYGWNINGAIAVPMTGSNGRPKWLTLSGFWASIEDDDRSSCTQAGNPAGVCTVFPLVDNPASGNFLLINAPATILGRADREVDHWGVSLESKWLISGGGGETYKGAVASNARYVALGADVRGIYQDLDLRYTVPTIPTFLHTLSEDLDTTYYGAYAAWGGDYQPWLFRGFWERHGLQSSFQLRGGVYYADTDYSGRTLNTFDPGDLNSTLSLSEDDVAFIGGIVLETRKKIGARSMLSLRSEYEYYSWVPEMRYLDSDVGGTVVAGPNGATSIGNDDAFSAKTMLRLTVALGGHPEPVKK